MSRNKNARSTGLTESRVRYLEAQGLVPAYGSVSEDDYAAALELVAAADASGMSVQRLRRAIGGASMAKVLSNQGGVMSNENKSTATYAEWLLLPLFEADGRRVTDMRRRVELLLPAFLRFAGQFVAGGADIALPKAASTSADFWGARSGGQYFGAEAHRFGLAHSGWDPQFIISREKYASSAFTTPSPARRLSSAHPVPYADV